MTDTVPTTKDWNAGALDLAGAKRLIAAGAKNMSPQCARVAHLLHCLYDGLYHHPVGEHALAKKDWSGDGITLSFGTREQLATYDYDHLTRLVFLAHTMCIRVSLFGSGQVLRAHFTPRHTTEGSIFERHPTIDGARAHFDAYMRGTIRAHERLEVPNASVPLSEALTAADKTVVAQAKGLVARIRVDAEERPLSTALPWEYLAEDEEVVDPSGEAVMGFTHANAGDVNAMITALHREATAVSLINGLLGVIERLTGGAK